MVLPAICRRRDDTGELTSEASEFVISVSQVVHRPDIWVFVGEAEGSEQFLKVSLETAHRLATVLRQMLDSVARPQG